MNLASCSGRLRSARSFGSSPNNTFLFATAYETLGLMHSVSLLWHHLFIWQYFSYSKIFNSPLNHTKNMSVCTLSICYSTLTSWGHIYEWLTVQNFEDLCLLFWHCASCPVPTSVCVISPSSWTFICPREVWFKTLYVYLLFFTLFKPPFLHFFLFLFYSDRGFAAPNGFTSSSSVKWLILHRIHSFFFSYSQLFFGVMESPGSWLWQSNPLNSQQKLANVKLILFDISSHCNFT